MPAAAELLLEDVGALEADEEEEAVEDDTTHPGSGDDRPAPALILIAVGTVKRSEWNLESSQVQVYWLLTHFYLENPLFFLSCPLV
jgi:hypothetical protein